MNRFFVKRDCCLVHAAHARFVFCIVSCTISEKSGRSSWNHAIKDDFILRIIRLCRIHEVTCQQVDVCWLIVCSTLMQDKNALDRDLHKEVFKSVPNVLESTYAFWIVSKNMIIASFWSRASRTMLLAFHTQETRQATPQRNLLRPENKKDPITKIRLKNRILKSQSLLSRKRGEAYFYQVDDRNARIWNFRGT